MEENNEYIMGDDGFWAKWGSKLLFTLISVKVWGLIISIWVSTALLYKCKISGGEWMTFNTTIWALIFGMKEVFRISQKRDETEKSTLNQQLESKVKIASVMASNKSNPSAPTINPDGTETVGAEPDA